MLCYATQSLDFFCSSHRNVSIIMLLYTQTVFHFFSQEGQKNVTNIKNCEVYLPTRGLVAKKGIEEDRKRSRVIDREQICQDHTNK